MTTTRVFRTPRSRCALDVLLAVGCLVVFTGPVLLGLDPGHGPGWAVLLFGVADAAPLLWRRAAPVTVLVLIGVVESAALLAGVRFTFLVSNAGVAIAVAVFTVAAQLPRRRALAATAVVLVTVGACSLLALWLYRDQDQDFVQFVVAVPAFLLGDVVRGRREVQTALRLQTERATAERDRRIRAEERIRLSRDVHDIVSHTLGMIAVRAGAGRVLASAIEPPADPELTAAFTAIEQGSRSALTELRHVLRSTRDLVGEPTTTAMPTLSDLDRLVAGVRESGLTVDLITTGDDQPMPALLESTAYRVVQEALTNVVKHAGARRVVIGLHRVGGVLRIEVTDDGRGAPAIRDTSNGSGLGILGMRERVQLWGGTLTAQSVVGNGFSLHAELPLPELSLPELSPAGDR